MDYSVHQAVAVANLDWLWAAVIGAGGALIGGGFGGWFVLAAGHKQWQRDRESSRTDRSREAAMAIAGAVGEMEVAIVAWQAEPDGQEKIAALMAAFNMFSMSVAIQSLALTDDDLRSRVRAHQTFVGVLGRQARADSSTALLIVGQVRKHTDELLDALGAHVHGTALPPYQPLPLDDAKALLSWRPAPRGMTEK
jgi:hypothetical protein